MGNAISYSQTLFILFIKRFKTFLKWALYHIKSPNIPSSFGVTTSVTLIQHLQLTGAPGQERPLIL